MFVSCQSDLKLPERPENLIQKDKMISVSRELLLVETAIEIRYGQLGKFYKISTKSGLDILVKYKVNEKQYFTSLEYYSCHKDEINEIYESILDSLNVMPK
jgi:hypothetical protein